METKKEVKKLLDIISEEIKKFNKNSSKLFKVNDEISKLNKLIDTIEKTPYEIDSFDYNEEIVPILVKYNSADERKDISNKFSKLSIPFEVIKARKAGIPLEYEKDDFTILDDVKDILFKTKEKVEKEIKDNEELLTKDNISKEKYNALYDKIRETNGGSEFIDEDDIDLIMSLTKDLSYEERKNILIHVHELNLKIQIDITNNLESVNEDYEEDDRNIELVDESLIRKLFEENQFNIDKIPKKIMNAFQKCKYKHLEDVMEYIKAHSEYDFLRTYTTDKKFVKLYQIFKYSNPKILDYLLQDSKNRDLLIEELFNKIEGVFRKNRNNSKNEPIDSPVPSSPVPSSPSDLSITGTFDNYKQNSLVLDELSKKLNEQYGRNDINIFQICLNRHPRILTIKPELIKRNLEIAEKYKLLAPIFISKRDNRSNGNGICVLYNTELAGDIDLLYEAGIFRHIQKYPSCLQYEKSYLYVMVEASLLGQLEFTSNDKIRDLRIRTIGVDPNKVIEKLEKMTFSIVPNEIVEELRQVEDMDLDYSDDVVEELDKYISTDEQDGENLIYNIEGTRVSRNKFLRNWKYLNNKYDDDNNLIYALTAGSYYRKDQFSKIESLVNSIKNYKNI